LTCTNTPTSTPTSYVAMAKKVSKDQASPGDNLTYTIAVTVVGGSIDNAVVTDILPADVSFLSFGGSPAGTTASFNAVTGQMQWILPSPLSPGVYSLTYQTRVGTFAQSNVPIINGVQLNYTGASAPLTSSVPVTVIGNFTVKINVYNE